MPWAGPSPPAYCWHSSFVTVSSQLSHGHINAKKKTHQKNLKLYLKIYQTLTFCDEEAGKVFHSICHKKTKKKQRNKTKKYKTQNKKTFFAIFALKPSLLNSYAPEQWATTKAPPLSIFSSASWPGTWTAFVEPGLGTRSAQTQNPLENRKFPK